ncbi:enoyl-CoA hydratase/isomerase family protein [Nocardioides sediminis]|uniref:enoyl-CoA hydratase/isomerase family protein n=1 Tax=Nocardioides sediminis TaxID=433648 RepID=UPI00131EEAE3|nr:enoyl-CoA hydratase-related protein [Nocardioides sediminis]
MAGEEAARPVETNVEGVIGWVRLTQADRRNPLDRETADALLAAFEQHFADDRVRMLAVIGEGEAFCAGGDLRQMGAFSLLPPREAFEWPASIVDLHRRMLRAEKPVVAAVNGPAFAGGMGLAGMCDVLIAQRSATFAMPEVRVGIFPMIIVAHLCRALPRKVLLDLMMTGRPLSAEAAERVGFVNKVVDDREDLVEAVRTYAGWFENAAPGAIALGRRTFGLLSELTADQALDAAQFLVLPFHLGEDLQEGADAFLGRRSPSWVPQSDG